MCVLCVLPHLMKACQMIHNTKQLYLFIYSNPIDISDSLSNIRWIFEKINLISLRSLIPEAEYIVKYMQFLDLEMHYSHTRFLSAFQKNRINIQRPETFEHQIWITLDPGNWISFQYKTEWQNKLMGLRSSRDAIDAATTTDCPICLEDLYEKEVVVLLNCPHVICQQCHLINFHNERKK